MVIEQQPPIPEDEDTLKFVEFDKPEDGVLSLPAWRLLIVDDEPDVHHVTKFALNHTTILGQPLEFLHAYSAAEARQILEREKDIAVILLDVVMERENAGLDLVKVIRTELKLTEIRIILRTGQAGDAPEIEAIHDYDINDYKTKSELTRTKLYASVTAAIRAFSQIRSLNMLAFTDLFSGLANRNRFIQLIDERLQTEPGREMSIAVVDIDDFSEINDALGHQQGDHLIKAVADRLVSHLPPGTVVARLSGDTFGLMGEPATVKPEALLQLFNTPFPIMEAQMSVTASIGIVPHGEIEGNAQNALKDAYIALKQAKKTHRGSFVLFSSEMGSEIRERVKLLRNLRSALLRERLFVVYQPQIHLQSRQVVGMEALVRWCDADGNFIPPDQFIPLAETSGLIIEIGDWVLRSACHELRRLRDMGLSELRMSVNVSQIQFREAAFLTRLKSALADSGIDPACLELEITESVAMEDVSFIRHTLNKIKALGISVAIDDFGTGYSSLSHLRLLPVDRLKIDRAFVNELSLDVEGGHFAAMVVELGRNLNLTVVAEGVETEAQAELLRSMGCHEAQGFHYARPMQPPQLIEWLQANRLQYGDHVPAAPIQSPGLHNSQ